MNLAAACYILFHTWAEILLGGRGRGHVYYILIFPSYNSKIVQAEMDRTVAQF